MPTKEEIEEQRNRVDFLRSQLAEQRLINKLNENEIYTNAHIRSLEKSGCEFRAKIVDLHTEVLDCRSEINRLNGMLSDRALSIRSFKTMCKSASEERNELRIKIRDLKDELSAQDQIISGINEAVKEWKVLAGCFPSMQKVSDLIDEWVTSEDVEADTFDVVVKVVFSELP